VLKEGEVYFNNNTSLNLNLYLEEYPKIPRANEQYEVVPIEGRNGDLYINKGTYPDRTIVFTFSIVSEDVLLDYDEIETWFTEIDDNRLFWGKSDKCFIVKKITFSDLEQEFTSLGKIEVTFICEPFRSDPDLISYEITSSGYVFYYEGNAPGEPLIKVYGTGNIQLTINGETMQVNNVTSYVEIDSKLMQVRNQDLTSKDNDTLGDFPLFSKGDNTISYTGSVTKIIVEYTNRYK
jgi:phage-related protein